MASLRSQDCALTDISILGEESFWPLQWGRADTQRREFSQNRKVQSHCAVKRSNNVPSNVEPAFPTSLLLKFQCVHTNYLEIMVKMQILILWVWGGTWEPAFLVRTRWYLFMGHFSRWMNVNQNQNHLTIQEYAAQSNNSNNDNENNNDGDYYSLNVYHMSNTLSSASPNFAFGPQTILWDIVQATFQNEDTACQRNELS